ncbi:hypothetical protein AB0N73_00415 [Microbacterium sp. NPDC089189]|uniref:hypothetical protein n=1 Tax=Microbacterium sp. NPDC089189 TaxID=3154972 RepID=UPI003423AA22
MTAPVPPSGQRWLAATPPTPRPPASATLSYVTLGLGVASPVLTILGFVLNNALVLAYDSPVRALVGLLPWLSGIAAIVVGIVALVRRARARTAAIIGMIVPAAGHLLLLAAWVVIFVGVMTVVGVGSGG